jgi:hypothetical protein
MPKLIKAAEANPKGTTRVVNVTSGSPRVASMRWSDMNFEKLNKDGTSHILASKAIT